MKSLKILVSVALLGVLAWRTDWAHVAEVFGQLQFGWWAAALGVLLFAQMLSSLRWQLLARPFGFDQPLSYFFGYYFIGMFFNLILPTSVGGDVVRAWYLDHSPGRRLSAFVSVFVDRLSGLLVLLALAGIATLFSPLDLPAWIEWSVWGTLSVFAIGAVGAWWYFGLRDGEGEAPAEPNAIPDSRLGGSLALPRRSQRFVVLQSAIRNLQSAMVQQPSLLFTTTLLSIGVQAANVVLVWLVGMAIAAPVPPGYYWIVVPMVSLLQVVLPSLNGHGVREGGLILFLSPVGVPAGTALTLSFLWFAVMATASLCGGAVYLFGRFPRLGVSADDNHDLKDNCNDNRKDDRNESIGDYSDQGRVGEPATAA
jgi:glycosyltransferase 2 family protein